MQTTTERREKFERLIEAAELEVRQNPRAYKAKVAMLALLGYVVIFGMLLLLFSILGGIGWTAVANSALLLLLLKKKVIFVLLAMIYVILRALWVKFDNPAGYEIKPADAPVLFKELKALTRKLGSPVVHQVLITPEYNAAILQTPRLGIFGWHKNTLFLGLELLLSMTPDQARSVLAHELGHLSGKHSRFSGRIYRVRLSWQRLMQGLDEQHNIGAELMRRFFNWYTPTFAAYSFALARSNEFSADRIAAKLTSKEVTAHALVNSYVIHDLLGECYWRPFFKQADEVSRPEVSPYKELMEFLQQNRFQRQVAESQILRALAVKTSHYDTHPSLKDRLKALKCKPKLPQPVGLSAAQHWFGDRLTQIISDFDKDWLKQNGSKWHDRYQHVRESRAKLAKIKDKPLLSLDYEEIWQFATLTEDCAPEEDCLPLYELYSQKRPDDADADYAIGRILLAKGDERGVEIITQACTKNARLKFNACEWLIYYYRQKNQENTAKYWQYQAERQIDIDNAAYQERASISKSDYFQLPDRTISVEKIFTDRILGIKGIKSAWVAEKRMNSYPEHKTFVIAIEKGLFDNAETIMDTIVASLEIEHNFFIVIKGGSHGDIAKQVIKKGRQLF